MPKQSSRLIVLVFFGVVFSVILQAGLDGYAWLAFPDPHAESAPMWYALSRPLLATLAQVAPAFLVGWFARQSGLLLGALVGAISSLAIQAVLRIMWQNVSFLPFEWFLLLNLLIWALSAAIVSSLAGGAGELAASRLPSNYSFKATVTGRCDNPAPGAAP